MKKGPFNVYVLCDSSDRIIEVFKDLFIAEQTIIDYADCDSILSFHLVTIDLQSIVDSKKIAESLLKSYFLNKGGEK